jgi:hypothetical protein
MNARRIFAAAAIAVATGSGAACAGDGPTLSSNIAAADDPRVLPGGPPTDTTGFIPPPVVTP